MTEPLPPELERSGFENPRNAPLISRSAGTFCAGASGEQGQAHRLRQIPAQAIGQTFLIRETVQLEQQPGHQCATQLVVALAGHLFTVPAQFRRAEER